MIRLEQVKLLEEKVESLIGVVKSLYEERDSLKETIAQKEGRIEELESVLRSFEISQAKIEESVMNALNQLDVFENSVANVNSPIGASDGAQDSEFSLSTASKTIETEEHRSDVVAKNTENEALVENEIQKNADDSDKQMDIF